MSQQQGWSHRESLMGTAVFLSAPGAEASKSEEDFTQLQIWRQPLCWQGLARHKRPTTPSGPMHHLPERQDARQGQIQVLWSLSLYNLGTEMTNTKLDGTVNINFE